MTEMRQETSKTCPHGAAGYCYKCAEEEFSLRKELLFIIPTALLLAAGIMFSRLLQETSYSWVEFPIFLAAYLLSGWNVLLKAYRNLSRGLVFDENFLMSVATVGALLIRQFPEAVAVMLFFKVGELLQELSVNRSRRSIKSLLDIRPDYANLKKDGELVKVPPDEVAIDNLIVVKPGERVPLDGIVLEGTSSMDTSALTGEAVPRRISPGENILAGMIARTGTLTIRVTKNFHDSSVSRIFQLMEDAADRKSQPEAFITTFARYYTPAVVLTALLVAIVPPLLITGASFSEWTYRALVLLVISCPCALVISIPLGYFGGIGSASKKGILVKGAAYLDALTKVKTVVFDKTGTLTEGSFQVTEIVPANGFTRDGILKLAAIIETQSNHPIAQSVIEAYGRPPDPSAVKDFLEITGQGIKANIDGVPVVAGNDALLHDEGISHGVCNAGGTAVHLAYDSRYAGYIIISDSVKDDALEAVRALKRHGVKNVIMLTGDMEAAAAPVAAKLGVDSYISGLLPEDKVKAVRELQNRAVKGDKLAFVGDGINDAPVIALADVGVAMGGLGSDAAIEAADIVIMSDAPSKLAVAIEIARGTRRIVWQNIVLALSIKGIFIALGTLGIATMWEAVFADMGVALLAILNSTRSMR
ncbi:MAG: heavy metal translocating P-type ATPase [Dehalococcoidia bacterium]|nr:heavy metal translocating P-type ATPase [Dehalococcoidia bacterium]MDZ4246933.1 heavy metal translocating P-type ATPase [Dehalococcoidia bacterium]